MAAGAPEPPPGFENVTEEGFAEPPEVLPTPSLGRRESHKPVDDRQASDSDSGSHGRRANFAVDAGELHRDENATQHEWSGGSGAASADEPGRSERSHVWEPRGPNPGSHRTSWSASTTDPWSHGESDPWQQDRRREGFWREQRDHREDAEGGSRGDWGRQGDHGDRRTRDREWRGDEWRGSRGDRYDQGDRWDNAWAGDGDLHRWQPGYGNLRAVPGEEWQRRGPGLLPVHEPEDPRGAPWADGRDPPHWQPDQGDQRGAWGEGRGADGRLGRIWEEDSSSWWKSSDGHYDEGRSRSYGRASEKLSVPVFTAEETEDLGGSARSYLRQVAAWRQMTLLPRSQQGLVLYQSLGGKAWIAAEELSVSRLGEENGIEYLISWIRARFLDLEVARIGRAFSDYFRKMRRRPGQTIRDYNAEYDRLFGRLREVGCNLPQEAAAWVYLDRLQLDEAQELNILASVGNRYDLLRLQQAAVLHDRGQRKPWEGAGSRGNKKPHYAHVTDYDDGDGSEGGPDDVGEEGIPEEVAEAWVTYQSAKEKYKNQKQSRGYNGDQERQPRPPPGDGVRDRAEDRDRDQGREARLKAMKAKSFCSGCGRRGHWHLDSTCPLNKGEPGGAKGTSAPKEVAMMTVMPADVYACRHVGDASLLGVTDTACARTVAGSQWLQAYTDLLQDHGQRPVLKKECEAYRFGTGKIHYSSFYVIVNFELGNSVVQLRTSIIPGDIPLLLSRTVLGKLGMVFDIEGGRADFTKVGLQSYSLLTTPSGHPAIPIIPAKADLSSVPVLEIEDVRLQPKAEYMTVFAVACHTPSAPQYTGIFYEKKLDPSVKDMLSQDQLSLDTFRTWWENTEIDRDFWVETPSSWMRIHVVPRRAMFNPSTWRTSRTILRDMLTGTLGHTRITEGICCSSGRWLEQTVDHWEDQCTSESAFTLLWIGRTVLFKQQPPTPTSAIPLRGNEQPGSMRERFHQGRAPQSDAQVSASGGGDETGNDRAPDLDSAGAPCGHPRALGGERRGGPHQPHEEDQLPQPSRASGQGGGARGATSGKGKQRIDPEAHPGQPEHSGQHLDDDRQVARMRVSGDSRGLWSLGPGRDHEIGELPSGPCPLREVVQERDGPEGCEDPHQRRRGGCELRTRGQLQQGQLEQFVGRRDRANSHEHQDRQGVCQDHTEARECRDEGQEQSDGSAAGPRGAGGDQSPGDKACNPQGQGPQQRAVKFDGGAPGDVEKEKFSDVNCCGYEKIENVITEEDYVRGYHGRVTNYATHDTHNEHHIPESEESMRYAGANLYKKFGGGDFDWGDYSFENCEKILEATHYFPEKLNLRKIHDGGNDFTEDKAYSTYGMFTHGGVIGVTRSTKDTEALVRYLNNFGKANLPANATWSSISVTKNIATTVHRDSNNLKGTHNYSASTGQKSGGQLWLEESDIDEKKANGEKYIWRRDRNGVWVPGKTHNTTDTFVEFNPFLRHGSCDWSGDRWCLTYHTVRGLPQCGPEIKKYLRNCGFRLPLLGRTRTGEAVVKPKATRSTKKTIMNAAGKLGVLMCTLMTAASSYLIDVHGQPALNDPIVMMEIGGQEGTIEATDLDKAVIEPFTWEDYVDPEAQVNAHHFVVGASPKELRIHLDGMPGRAKEPVSELIREQIEAGGEVVLRKGDPSPFLETYAEYVKYKSHDSNDAWVVLGKQRGGVKSTFAGRRPHDVCAVEADEEVQGEKIKYDGSGITFESPATCRHLCGVYIKI